MTAIEILKDVRRPRRSCKRGHPWIPKNIYRHSGQAKGRYSRGSYCKVCAALACRKWYDENVRRAA